MSNERQIGLSYLATLNDVPNEDLCDSSVGNWVESEMGRPEKGWICPDAPRVEDGVRFSFGSVHTAWVADTGGNGSSNLGQGDRVGSYGLNQSVVPNDEGFAVFHLAALMPADPQGLASFRPDFYFIKGSAVQRPAQTPLLGDWIHFDLWWREPTNFPFWDLTGATWDWKMNYQPVVPRHGRRLQSTSRGWPMSQPLPGAINVTFFDSHVELVPLDKLWQLYWYKDLEPRAKRPGLP